MKNFLKRLLADLVIVSLTVCIMGSGVWRYILPNGVFVQGLLNNGIIQDMLGTSSGGNDVNLNYAASNNLNITRAGSTQWRMDASSNILGNNSLNTIAALTNDASDANSSCLGGGGACSSIRGGSFTAYGNENIGQTGSSVIEAGNVANASIQFRGAGSSRGQILGSTGAMTMVDTITSSRTTDLGWSVQSATNQACNTTCTSACVFGQNLTAGVPGTLLACTDATADVCLCAGAS